MPPQEGLETESDAVRRRYISVGMGRCTPLPDRYTAVTGAARDGIIIESKNALDILLMRGIQLSAEVEGTHRGRQVEEGRRILVF